MTREFDNFSEAMSFMAQLSVLDISYIARIITPPKRRGPPFMRVVVLEVSKNDVQH